MTPERKKRFEARKNLILTQYRISVSTDKHDGVYDDYCKILKLNKEDQLKLELYINLNCLEWFTEVVTLSNGQSFGELALINDAPRAATIHCISECYFAVIGRPDYEKVLKKIDWKC